MQTLHGERGTTLPPSGSRLERVTDPSQLRDTISEMAKNRRPSGWDKAIERATRALAANKRRLDAASTTGLASDKTLGAAATTPIQPVAVPTVPKPFSAPPPAGKRRKKRQRR